MKNMPEIMVALYVNLRDVQAATYDLEQAGLSYPALRIEAHSEDDNDYTQFDVAQPPDFFWSLSVLVNNRILDRTHTQDILQRHQPFAVGCEPAPLHGRDDVDRGAIAWRHYVFTPPPVNATLPESLGSSGTTGTISTGIFAKDVHAEGDSPVPGLAGKQL